MSGVTRQGTEYLSNLFFTLIGISPDNVAIKGDLPDKHNDTNSSHVVMKDLPGL